MSIELSTGKVLPEIPADTAVMSPQNGSRKPQNVTPQVRGLMMKGLLEENGNTCQCQQGRHQAFIPFVALDFPDFP